MAVTGLCFLSFGWLIYNLTGKTGQSSTTIPVVKKEFDDVAPQQPKASSYFNQKVDSSSSDSEQCMCGDDDLIYVGNSELAVTADMNNVRAEGTFFRFISYRHMVCKETTRFGAIMAGGWEICLAPPYKPTASCLVYSFGVKDFVFENGFASNLGCTVRAFDPRIEGETPQKNDKVSFYKTGLGGKNEVNDKGWTIKTLSTLKKEFKEDSAVIDYLKLDIQGAEWASLDDMISTGAIAKVRQLAIQLNVFGKTSAEFLSYYQTLSKLEEAGFRRWHFTMNYYKIKRTPQGFRSASYEVVYINGNFLDDWETLSN
jgi:hypothetical protein